MFHSILGSPAFYKLNSIKMFHPVVVSPTFCNLNSNQMFHSILGSPTFCELNGIKMFNSVVGSPAFYKLNSIKMIHSSLGSPTIKLFQLILGSRTLTPRPHHCLCFDAVLTPSLPLLYAPRVIQRVRVYLASGVGSFSQSVNLHTCALAIIILLAFCLS